MWNRKAAIICVSLIGALILIIGGVAGVAQANSPSDNTVKDHGTWEYKVTHEDAQSTQIFIAYDNTTVTGLKAFAQTNRDLAKSLKQSGTKRFEALITFNRPLSLEEFTRLVADNHLTVDSYTMRMNAANGERWTITGGPVNGSLIPQDKLAYNQQFVLQHAPTATFAGVVDVQAVFDVAQYDKLQTANGVFLVDITRTVAKQETLPNLTNGEETNVTVDCSHPYWYMEDLGLQNFR